MTGAPPAPPGKPDRVEVFRAAVRSGEADRLGRLLVEDVRLRSPVRFKPYVGRPAALRILAATARVLGRPRDLARLDDGPLSVLVYEAEVGDQTVQGVDLIRFDAEGRVAEITVFLRPASGLEATRQAMVSALGPMP